MPRIPVTRQQSVLTNVPSPTGAGSAINTDPGAGQGVQQLGRVIGELGTRMREQALAEKKVKLEMDARQRLADIRRQSIQSDNFREAPEQYQQQAQAVVEDTVEQAPFAIRGDLQTQLLRKTAVDKAELRQEAVQKSQQNQLQATQNVVQQLSQDYANAETPQERQVIAENIRSKAQNLSDTGIMLPAEAENFETQGILNAQRARAQQLIADKRPDAATSFVKNSDLPAEDKRQLLSMAENQAGQNAREYTKYVNDVANFVSKNSRLPQTVAGVPYETIKQNVQGTEAEAELNFLEGAAKEARTHLNTRTVPEQRQALQEMRVTGTRDQRRKELLASVTKEAERAADERPFQYAEENGVLGKVRELPLQDIVTGQGDTNAVENVLSERVAQAEQLSQYYGQPVSPFRPDEVRTMTEVLDQGSADQGTMLLQNVSSGLGFAQTQRFADQVAKDSPQLGVAALVAPDAPEVTREILAGREIDAEQVKLPQNTKRQVTDEFLGEALQGSPRSRQAFMEAASAIYRKRAVAQGDTDEANVDLYRRSLALVAHGKPAQNGEIKGGPVEINGVKTLPPAPGVSGKETRRLFSALQDRRTAFQLLDGRQSEFTNGTPGRLNPDGQIVDMAPEAVADAQPVYVGGGRYMFKMQDGGFVHALDMPDVATSADAGEPTGQPLVFNAREALSSEVLQGVNVSVNSGFESLNPGDDPGPLGGP